MYTDLFVLCLLFTNAFHDTSQLRGSTSVALRSNAQQAMKGIPQMDGRLLIKRFYVTNDLENNHTMNDFSTKT